MYKVPYTAFRVLSLGLVLFSSLQAIAAQQPCEAQDIHIGFTHIDTFHNMQFNNACKPMPLTITITDIKVQDTSKISLFLHTIQGGNNKINGEYGKNDQTFRYNITGIVIDADTTIFTVRLNNADKFNIIIDLRPQSKKDKTNKGSIPMADHDFLGTDIRTTMTGCNQSTYCIPAFDPSVGYHIVYNPCCGSGCKFGKDNQVGNGNQISMIVPKYSGSLKSRIHNPVSAIKKIYHPGYLHARAGHPLTFDVININPFKYNVSITKSDTNYNESDALIVDGIVRKYATSLGSAQAAGTETAYDPIEVFSYFKKLAFDVGGYMDAHSYQDCIDMSSLGSERDAIFSASSKLFADTFKLYSLDKVSNYLYVNHDKIDSSDFVNAMVTFTKFRNYSFRYAYLIPQVQNKDEVVYTLNIHPKDSTQSTGIRVTNEQIHIPVRGGFKIDGSVGVFYSSLANQQYYARPDSFYTLAHNGHDSVLTKGNRVLPTQKNFLGEFGAMALVHFYPRLSRIVNVAFTGGVGVTFDKSPSPRGLVGGSIMFGKSNRLAISGGAVLGPVQVLKSQFASPALYSQSSDFTETRVRVGGFLSLSYNFNFSTAKGAQQPAGGDNSGSKTPSDSTGKTKAKAKSVGSSGKSAKAVAGSSTDSIGTAAKGTGGSSASVGNITITVNGTAAPVNNTGQPVDSANISKQPAVNAGEKGPKH